MTRLSDQLSEIRRRAHAGNGESAWEELHRLGQEMKREGRGRDEPRRAVFGLLGDRWSMLILLVLETGTWRHATLKRLVGTLSIEGAISQRMLTLKLRQLERFGLIVRKSTGDAPKQVDYKLSPVGRDLLLRVRQLGACISHHRSAIEKSRDGYDLRNA